jgi:hypothetical protein
MLDRFFSGVEGKCLPPGRGSTRGIGGCISDPNPFPEAPEVPAQPGAAETPDGPVQRRLDPGCRIA